VSDPASGLPVESELTTAAPRASAFSLLRRADFRRLYFAIGASELGSSLHYIALMWFALEAGGPLGVIAVRLADSIPAIVFGLHGGVAADRWSRRRLMIGSDLVRGVVLLPVAVAGLAGGLPLWAWSSRRSCSRLQRATSSPLTARRCRRWSTGATCNRPTPSSRRRRRRSRSAAGRSRRHC